MQVTPSTTNTAAPWVCVGCGKEAVGKIKSCDCPSGLIYQRGDLKSAELALTQQQGGEQAAAEVGTVVSSTPSPVAAGGGR